MGERSGMKPFSGLFAIAAFAGLLVQAAAPASAVERSGAAKSATAPTDISAQSQSTRRARPRPQLRVQPRYPYRNYNSFYPLPYDVEYPGPNAKRYCTARYVTEYRPSGTVVVPSMRCWWGPG